MFIVVGGFSWGFGCGMSGWLGDAGVGDVVVFGWRPSFCEGSLRFLRTTSPGRSRTAPTGIPRGFASLARALLRLQLRGWGWFFRHWGVGVWGLFGSLGFWGFLVYGDQ